MPELKIIISSEYPLATKIFVEDEQIGLVQQLRFEASAERQGTFHLEMEFPPNALIPHMSEGLQQRLERHRALVEPFLSKQTPPPMSKPHRTSWEHINAGLGIEDE